MRREKISSMLNFSNLPKKWKSLLFESWEPVHSLLISSKRFYTELKINEKLENTEPNSHNDYKSLKDYNDFLLLWLAA